MFISALFLYIILSSWYLIISLIKVRGVGHSTTNNQTAISHNILPFLTLSVKNKRGNEYKGPTMKIKHHKDSLPGPIAISLQLWAELLSQTPWGKSRRCYTSNGVTLGTVEGRVQLVCLLQSLWSPNMTECFSPWIRLDDFKPSDSSGSPTEPTPLPQSRTFLTPSLRLWCPRRDHFCFWWASLGIRYVPDISFLTYLSVSQHRLLLQFLSPVIFMDQSKREIERVIEWRKEINICLILYLI